MKKVLFALLLLANAGYAQVNLNQGLVAYYPFSGNPNEVTGNGVNGILTNGPALSTDRFGNVNSAYYFDGNDDYIRIPSNPTINPARQFSIALYFNSESNALQTILGKIGYFAGIGTQFQIAINFSLYPGILYGVNPPSNNCAGVPLNGNYVNTGLGSITSNQWYCVVATYDNSVQKIYLNGVLIQTSTASFLDLNVCSNADVQIGSWWNGDPQRFRGKIDDVRFYNRALNAAEAAALCNTTTPIIINDYTPALALNSCKNELTVLDATKYNVGDTVLLIQMKGAAIDSSNSANFGTITNYRNTGNYEFNYVKSKTGNIIELRNVVTRLYDFAVGKVQLVRVPYFQKLNVTSELTCLPWDGTIGGVLAFNVQDSLLLNAALDVSGKGFRGGRGINTNNNNWFCNSPAFYYPSGSFEGAEKGEGIAEISNSRLNGKGPLANGGGGGNQSNAGGGGGGNAGMGGKGGHQFGYCTSPQDNRGMEGKNISVISQNRIFLGGGGGSGDANNPGFNAFSSVGGAGGGIIIISANKIISQNSSLILANGAQGLDCNTGNCHEGMAGGGAGGSVLIQANSFIGTQTNIEVKGGKGADASHTLSGSIYEHGPGGGGAGGLTWISQAALPSNVAVAGNGGINGVNINFGNSSWGATPGANGATLFNLALPIDNIAFAANIDSVRIKDSVTSCNSYDFKGLGFIRTNAISQWQWSFGDGGTANTQNTSHIYSLPGTYTVKLVVTDLNGCKDSISIPVTTSGISNDFSYKQDICNPLSIQFNSLGPVPSSTYWNFGDGNTTTANANPVHIYAGTGNYVVKYAVQTGTCSDTIIKTISVNVLPDDIVLTPDTTICLSSTKQLRYIPSLNFCWSPTTYLNNPLLANPVTSTPVPITYYLTAEVTGTNIITNGNFNAGNSAFTSGYNFAANNITEGEFFVGPSPQVWNAALSNCGDHTTGSGNMLLVNGSPVPNVKVWTQTVTVTPNTNYAFSSWIQALSSINPAQLSFSINGADVGTLITASLPTCNWSQFYTTWNSGSNTSALISIVNKNTIVQGNYFALDDISFAPVFIKRDSVKITVDTPVVRTITDTAACRNIATTLTTSGAATYTWTPAAGLNATNIANPVATPTATTQYIVSGTNSFGCIAKDTVIVTVKPAPVIVKSPNDTICVLQSAQLNVSGGVSYSWFPGGSLNNPSIANPVATPAGNTTYIVTVTGANTCINTDSIKISIDTVIVNTIADAAACLNTGTTLNTTGAVLYSWFPATGLSAANISNPIATPAANTQYVVTGTSAAGCTDTDTVNVTVKPLPVVSTSIDDAVCVNESIQISASGGVSYSWLPAQTLSNASVSNPVASPSANTMYYVIVTGANNCTNKDSVFISVKSLPVISKSADDTICITQSAQLSAAGGTSYTWTPAGSLSNANIANPVATPVANTMYYVTVTGTNNCKNMDSVNIRVNPLPVFNVSATVSTCINGNAQLSASGGNSYTWSPAGLVNNALISNPIATAVPANTLFSVIIRDNVCNLQQTLSTMVRTDLVSPTINATKLNDIDCVFPASQLNVSGADNYSWSPATGLSASNISNPLAQPASSTLYTVEGINNFTNCKSNDTITVLVKTPAPPAAYIPNSFTPNGDGKNDCFRVMDFGTIKTREIIIYNRYGNLVFQTKNATDCWDGYYKGQPAEVGNYVYYIKVLNDCGEEIKKGNLLLLR